MVPVEILLDNFANDEAVIDDTSSYDGYYTRALCAGTKSYFVNRSNWLCKPIFLLKTLW